MAETRGRGPGPTLAKDINRKLIYSTLKRLRTSSRAELAALLELNKNTVNSIVDELAEAGYIRMSGLQAARGAGRKAVRIDFLADHRKAIGFQLLSRSLVGVVTDLYAKPLETVNLPLGRLTPESAAAQLAAFVEQRFSGEGDGTLIGVGLGVPALLDLARERVVQSTHLGWRDVPLKAMLEEKLHRHVLLDNSVKLASQGELWHGDGKGTEHFAYCSFGAGVGCGLIVGGEIVRGETGIAGELGHVVVEPGGPVCACGNSGCLEAVVGLPGVYRRLAQRLEIPADAMDEVWLADRARCGDEAVLAEMDRIGHGIGQALAGLVNLLNPKRIICDGPLMLASDVLFPIIREQLRKSALSAAAAQAELVRSSLHPHAGAIGAAAGVIRAWEQQADPLEPIPL